MSSLGSQMQSMGIETLRFSPTTRALQWEALDQETFDVLVIGGGITGVAIARDAACRGLSVALVEARDFAHGTSSRSSRLIHGGLRYLETLDFGLVFEALNERRRLFRLAPHLVHPLPFLFPVFRGDEMGPLKLRAGMWLYDALALFRNIETHRMLDREATLRQEPSLRGEGLRGAALYYDAQVDDARLTLAVARGAHEAGALTVPHAEVTAFLKDASGRVSGARVRDRIRGGEKAVRARTVISATGPWTDRVRRLADPGVVPRLRPTKGVHIVLRRDRVGNRTAIVFRSAVDRRVMFVLPWGEFTYIGTTDTDIAADQLVDQPIASPEDVAYLLDSANVLLPTVDLSESDVISTWAGIRPLVAPDTVESITASQTSREHEIWRDPSGLVCIAGGKLTTFRVMAKHAADTVAKLLQAEHGVQSGDCYTEHLPIPGAPEEAWDAFQERMRTLGSARGLNAATVDHLARAYGADALEILNRIGAEPALARPILHPLPYVWAEIPHVLRNEMPMTLEDVLQRRLHLLYEAPDGGAAVATEIARRMATEPGIQWDGAAIAEQVDRYLTTAAANRPV